MGLFKKLFITIIVFVIVSTVFIQKTNKVLMKHTGKTLGGDTPQAETVEPEPKEPVIITPKEDFLGNWVEILAGRINVDIVDIGEGNVEVTYSGANSAYSHTVSKSVCTWDSESQDLVCDNTTTVTSFPSCNGISADSDFENYSKCQDETPENVIQDEKTVQDSTRKIISIKKGTEEKYIGADEEYLQDVQKQDIKDNYENMALYYKTDDNKTYFYKRKSGQ